MVGGGGGHFWEKGTKVEVTMIRNEEGSNGAWYEATIIEPPWKSSTFKKTNEAFIQYEALVTDDSESDIPFTEYVNERFIRPVPPKETRECFELNDVVDAFFEDGWLAGVIIQVLANSRYAVLFQNPHDKIEFDCSALRLHLDWINGEWVRPEKETPSSDATISRPLKRQKKGDTTEYNGGEKIEATQQVGVGNQIADTVKRKVRLSNLHVKSSPTSMTGMEIKWGGENEQQNARKECVTKEAKMSAVLGIQSEKTNESLGKNACKLHSEIGQRRECGFTNQTKRRGRPRKLPVVSQKSTIVTDAVGKACTSDEVSTTAYTNSTGSQDPSIGKIGGDSETECSRQKAKMANTKISEDVTGDHQPLRVCSEGFSSGGTANQWNEAKESQVELPRIDCTDNNMMRLNQKLPFVKSSPIWEVIESMEVFQTMHQNPHFHPLYDFKEERREGLAIGTMVTFANIVERTCKLQLDDPRSIWVNYLEVLPDMETHGFDVQLLRVRLNELLAIRDRHEQNLEELKESQSRLLEDVNNKSKIDDEIDELDKKIKELEEERASTMLRLKIHDSEIASLQLRADDIRECLRSTQLDFERVSAAPW